ncbi:protein kinase domain-containing protein [Nannocystis radixulma]|uniref:Protein kinase n=1 Tax=Nannocystis radixulma TaxID=2995305 RepID=A0ABT5BEG3_9BACT|nr:protein kinase [Nannocystis radixulma]MDC0672542.1 protein kinase [Nannocystis radixulma]
MTGPQLDPLQTRAGDRPAPMAIAIDVAEPRERVRSVVAARLFGDVVMPARIHRFELIRELGAGGMGAVYAAHDPDLDRAVALKVLARTGEGPEASRRLVREAQAMARLKHPNVVAVHEVGTHGEQVFVAMELVEGGTLAQWMRGGPRPWREVLALLIPAGRGLAAAHAAGLVHRDFKPANVLLGADGRALVSDFGLARAGAEPGAGRPLDEAEATAELERPLLETPLTRTGALLGTPSYMAPEQFRGEMATPRSDVFAFCVVVWEAIFGQRPFAGATIDALVGALEHGRLTSPSSIKIPPALRRELSRGLSAQPADRHASMTELLAALERAGNSATARRILVAAGAVFAGLTAVIMGAYVLSSSPETGSAGTRTWVETIVEDPAQFLERWQLADHAQAGEPRTVDREQFLAVLGSQEALGRHARVMPVVNDEVFGGYRIYGLRPNTPLKAFGFYNGDTLVAIDQQPMTPAVQWDEVVRAAVADGEVEILVKRKNEGVPLRFRLTDATAAK